MKTPKTYSLTREKHLDHMVKVVPFIVFCYAAQSFIIFKVSPTQFSGMSLTLLGGLIAAMITAFITYDLKHSADFLETEIKVSFLGFTKSIPYTDIHTVEVQDPGHSFSNLIIKTGKRKHVFYFIDEAEKVKAWIEEKNQVTLKAA